jgi:hypothetical protein
MRVSTLACEKCGTVVAANELEKRRVMKCPGIECESVFRFESLPKKDREYIVDHRDRYRVE